MMDDVRDRRADCIVVKDLSRFGRNYIETGYYLETIFLFLNVRFVAITDNYDTGEDGFGEEMHILLRDTLKGIKGKFILSYNDDEFIRELYKDFVIEEVERSDNLKMAMGEKGSRYKELIIRNF